MMRAYVSHTLIKINIKQCLLAHRQIEDVGQLRQAVEHDRDERKRGVCAQDAERGDGAQVAKELLLLHRQPRIEDDGRQQVPACGEGGSTLPHSPQCNCNSTW